MEKTHTNMGKYQLNQNHNSEHFKSPRGVRSMSKSISLLHDSIIITTSLSPPRGYHAASCLKKLELASINISARLIQP